LVFSCNFIQDEIKEASNIKDKNNRKNVIRILTVINSQLKLQIIGDNGILIFCGINRNGVEIMDIIRPLNPISEFYYNCAKHFEIERFNSLFDEKPIGHVIFISGTECLLYQFNGSWKKLKTINANLIKRHHKGGQSSVRFSRLAEESRTHYITHIVDWINQLIAPGDNNYVYGGRELKMMLLVSPNLKISLKTDDLYHTFNEQTIHENFFDRLVINPSMDNDKKIEQVSELLERDPDYLLFSYDEINQYLDHIEYIVTNRNNISYEKKKVILIPINHPKYGQLKNYPIIGKLYHKMLIDV